MGRAPEQQHDEERRRTGSGVSCIGGAVIATSSILHSSCLLEAFLTNITATSSPSGTTDAAAAPSRRSGIRVVTPGWSAEGTKKKKEGSGGG